MDRDSSRGLKEGKALLPIPGSFSTLSPWLLEDHRGPERPHLEVQLTPHPTLGWDAEEPPE